MSVSIISKFRQKPHTKVGWWTMGLGMVTLLGVPFLSFFAAVIRPLLTNLSEANSQALGINLGLFTLLISAAAVVVGIIALRRGERSWLVWLGFVLAVITLSGYALMILADIIGLE